MNKVKSRKTEVENEAEVKLSKVKVENSNIERLIGQIRDYEQSNTAEKLDKLMRENDVLLNK